MPYPTHQQRCAWTLRLSPRRRIGLLIINAQEEYRQPLAPCISNMVKLYKCFKDLQCLVIKSSWYRTIHDNIRNSMDRFYGPTGITQRTNPLYVYGGDKGLSTLSEIVDIAGDKMTDLCIYQTSFDVFDTLDRNNHSVLEEKLLSRSVDTLVK